MALVIIVDDDNDVRASLENFLDSVGYTIASFASGEALIEDGAWAQADCMLLDVRMRGMSGLDLQQHLSSLGNETPIIFLTAHCDVETRTRAISGGAFAFFSKPFDEEILLSALEKAVNRSARDE